VATCDTGVWSVAGLCQKHVLVSVQFQADLTCDEAPDFVASLSQQTGTALEMVSCQETVSSKRTTVAQIDAEGSLNGNDAITKPPTLARSVQTYMDQSGVTYNNLDVRVDPLSRAGIAGVVLGGVAAVLIVLIVSFVVYKRMKQGAPPSERV